MICRFTPWSMNSTTTAMTARNAAAPTSSGSLSLCSVSGSISGPSR